MGAGALLLLFVLLVFVVIAVGALSAARAGLWARETGPVAEEPRDGDGERPRHVIVEDENEARSDVSSREPDGSRR
jgi:heme A synthase